MRRLRALPTRAMIYFGLVTTTLVGLLALRSTGFVSPSLQLNIITPLTYLLLAGVGYWLIGGARSRVHSQSLRWQVVMAVFVAWFALYFLSGLMMTYQRNVLFGDILLVLQNLAVFGVAAAAFEYIRSVTMMLAGRRNAVWFGAIVAIVYTLALLDVAAVAWTDMPSEIIKQTMELVVPALSTSFLMTYLVVTSGLRVAVSLRLALVASTILLPIIPRYDWYMTGVSTLLLAVGVVVALNHVTTVHGPERQVRHRRSLHKLSDITGLLVLVAIVTFMTGVFSYRPLAVMSDSMRPTFARGAMVVVQERTVDMQVGDIIQYQRQDRMIIHRVVGIDEASEGAAARTIYTKGDNSPSVDPPVYDDQIRGIVRASVPYIGYPTVWLYGSTQ